MNNRVLITGSSGLVGSALRRALEDKQLEVVGLDVRARGRDAGDIRDLERVRAGVEGCVGVVHLAAVSRVIWGERDPELCQQTNIGGLENLLRAAFERANKPWVIFASSREVYGQPARLPADEDAPLRPVNTYGRTKVEGERLVEAARRDGLRAATIRLSNVYGSVDDHSDRVVPAFVRAAALGLQLRVDGAGHTFDFTHIDDTTRGIVGLIELLRAGQDAPPPIHFLTGQPTTLGRLARATIALAGTSATIREAPARSFDVARFYGSPARARSLLGWTPRVSIREGLARLIGDLRQTLDLNLEEVKAS